MVFFDIDGTLVDHKGAERAAALAFHKDHAGNFPESPDEFLDHWQILAEIHFHRYLTGAVSFQEQRRARIRELFVAVDPITDHEADEIFSGYLQRYEQNWRLFEDVGPCLTDVERYGLGIISNGHSSQQRAKLKALGIADRFSTVLISEDIGMAKPMKEIFTTACRAASKRPDECVYVGDDFEVDAQGSRRAGMRSIWLNRSRGNSRDGYEVITSLTELKRQIEMPNHTAEPASPSRGGSS